MAHEKNSTKKIATKSSVCKETNLKHYDVGCNIFHKTPIVRHEHDGPRAFGCHLDRFPHTAASEERFKPQDCVEVKVIRWLIQEQYVGLNQQGCKNKRDLLMSKRDLLTQYVGLRKQGCKKKTHPRVRREG